MRAFLADAATRKLEFDFAGKNGYNLCIMYYYAQMPRCGCTSEDIYGKEMTLDFCEYLREEKRFGSIAELMKQLEADHQYVRSYFKLNLN